jgi:putative DNA primase/helicase
MTSTRPMIQARAGDLHNLASEAERALVDAESPFFVRGGIVRPVIDEMAAAHGQRTKAARLCPVDCDTLIDHLSRAADWMKWNERKKGLVPTDPPRNVAATIIARDGEWKFRRLAGVITTPTLRPDGTILSEPGYDPATQLLLLDPPKLPAIPDKPTRANALSALAYLDKLLDEFPFVDAASRSAALSGLITPVVRGAMPVAPLHATTAPVAGSGKSYIIDLASAISTGERAPVIAAGRTEEETEKRLGAALLNGQAIVSIDNVNGQLGGDALCQMIERPVVSVRPLGVSKLVKIESRATCFATGNNIQMVGDMTRRTIVCSLDPNMERPELRTFTASPFHAVIASRGNYVAAVLMIARAYAVAGYPDALPALASFEDWSRVVRSALVWLGRADPCETMEKARADDPVIGVLSGVLQAWHDTIGSTAQTTGQVKETAEVRNPLGNIANGDLHDALIDIAEGKRGGIDSKNLGKYLGRHKGRVVGGLKVVALDDTHGKQLKWKVVRM